MAEGASRRGLIQESDKNHSGVEDHLVGFVFVQQNAIIIELCLRITIGCLAFYASKDSFRKTFCVISLQVSIELYFLKPYIQRMISWFESNRKIRVP